MVKRMKHILSRLIWLEQGTFIGGQSMIENVMIAYEVTHDLRRILSNRYLMATKLDME